MKTMRISSVLALIVTAIPLQSIGETLVNEEALKAEASQIAQQFGGLLKPRLKEAIQSGGLDTAVTVCAVEAPKIAKNLGVETGWDIQRVSLKARNQATATPDNFELNVLKQFDERQRNGEPPSKIGFSKVVNGKFRFMVAQGVEGICLNCHGSSIPAEVKKALDMHYPEDVATGYSLGQIRGAISLSKRL